MNTNQFRRVVFPVKWTYSRCTQSDIRSSEIKSEACVTTVGVDAIPATLPHGRDKPPQSPGGSLAAPAAESGTPG